MSAGEAGQIVYVTMHRTGSDALATYLQADSAELMVQTTLHNTKQILLVRPRMRRYAPVYPPCRSVRGLLKSVHQHCNP